MRFIRVTLCKCYLLATPKQHDCLERVPARATVAVTRDEHWYDDRSKDHPPIRDDSCSGRRTLLAPSNATTAYRSITGTQGFRAGALRECRTVRPSTDPVAAMERLHVKPILSPAQNVRFYPLIPRRAIFLNVRQAGRTKLLGRNTILRAPMSSLKRPV